MEKIKKPYKKNILDKVASKDVLEKNISSMRAYEIYKKNMKIIESIPSVFENILSTETNIFSTLDFEIDCNGFYSTNAKKI